MHSKEVISLVQKKREDGLSVRKIAAEMKLPKSTVEYMLSTDYEQKKKKRGRKKNNFQENRKKNEEECYEVVIIWRKGDSKESKGEVCT